MFVPQENRNNGPALRRGLISDVIMDAADLLRQQGWLPMNPNMAGKPGMCIGIAVARAAFGKVQYHEAAEAVLLAAQIQTGRQWRDLPQYNDAPGRTVADVYAVMELAAAQ